LTSKDGFDLSAFHWILNNTRPADLFVTQDAENDEKADGAFTVMATGRRVVSVPNYFSNPYVDWVARDAKRKQYLSALTGSGQEICALVAEAGSDAAAWFLVANDTAVNSAMVDAVFRTELNTVYRVRANCVT
jgi:hypothetical protein